jgi:plastocyanin
MTRYTRLTVLFLALLMLGLAACGGDDEGTTAPPPTTAEGAETGGGGGGTVQISTPSGVEFDTDSLEASAGQVTIEYTNDSGLPHNVTLEGGGADGEATDTITEGETSLTVDLEAGEYTFFCSVEGHRAAGMEGTLVVD